MRPDAYVAIAEKLSRKIFSSMSQLFSALFLKNSISLFFDAMLRLSEDRSQINLNFVEREQHRTWVKTLVRDFIQINRCFG